MPKCDLSFNSDYFFHTPWDKVSWRSSCIDCPPFYSEFPQCDIVKSNCTFTKNLFTRWKISKLGGFLFNHKRKMWYFALIMFYFFMWPIFSTLTHLLSVLLFLGVIFCLHSTTTNNIKSSLSQISLLWEGLTRTNPNTIYHKHYTIYMTNPWVATKDKAMSTSTSHLLLPVGLVSHNNFINTQKNFRPTSPYKQSVLILS